MSTSLNPQQQQAIKHLETPLLVLAGAGSGKTRVITEKIAHLIQNCGYAPQHITAITFTNKAAREMKERVAKRLKNIKSRGLFIATFHTFGLTVLRKHTKHVGLRPNFSIFDQQDSLTLLKELLPAKQSDTDVNAIQRHISTWKNQLLTPEQALSEANDEHTYQAAQLYEPYQRQLRAYNAVDFDDLINVPTQLWQTHPEILEQWQRKTRYLLVDEYQDTNYSQYQLIKQLLYPQGRFTVVGDDAQSIYAWRGARPENLLDLQQDFPRSQVVKLEQNYRSCGRILKAANQLIASNSQLLGDKKLWSELGYGDPLRVICTPDEATEAERVVHELQVHQFKHQLSFEHYAILYRNNYQAKAFERELRQRSIPYKLSGGTSFFARSEVKDLMAYLRLLNNPDDDTALLRIINTPRRGIGTTTLAKLGEYAQQRQCSLFAAIFEMGLQQQLSSAAYEKLQQFGNWCNRTADNCQRGDTLAVIQQMLQDIEYEAWLTETSTSPAQAEKRQQNVTELLGWLRRLLEPEDEADALNFSEAVSRLCLLDQLDNNDKTAYNQVQLLTLHAAKGLEFDHVFLVGMEEGLLPHQNNLEDEERLAEERRLAYVGITRARRTLTFTLARTRKQQGAQQSQEPSRFLQELPQDDIDWEGTGIQSDPQQQKRKAKEHLAHLRALVDPATP